MRREFKRNNIPCKGFFVSLSGGFDSAYTLTILALSLDIKLRKLSESKGGFKNALVEICVQSEYYPRNIW